MNRLFNVILTVLLVMLVPAAAAPVDWAVVQRELKKQGLYYGEIDGRSGSETLAAVNRFQIRKGLPVTGRVDQATWHALTTDAPDVDRSGQPASATGNGEPSPVMSTWFEPAVTDRDGVTLSLDQLFVDTELATGSEGRKRAALREVQRKMKEAETYSGQIDGDPGPRTHQGLLDYQAKFGLAQTAAVDPPTLEAMGLDQSKLGAGADRPRQSTSRRGSRDRDGNVIKRTGRSVERFFRRIF